MKRLLKPTTESHRLHARSARTHLGLVAKAGSGGFFPSSFLGVEVTDKPPPRRCACSLSVSGLTQSDESEECVSGGGCRLNQALGFLLSPFELLRLALIQPRSFIHCLALIL